MRCFNLFKCCKGDTGVDLDYLPPARAIELKKTGTKRVNSFLPISTKPIPELDVSPSSSTSLAMFDFEAITSVPFGINSFTAQGNYEDVDLSSPTNFCSPPVQAHKALSSPFGDHYEVDRTLAIDGNTSDDEEGSYSSSPCSTESSVLFDQSSRVNSYNTCPSPFGDEHEFDYDVEYAPTTHPSKSEYTERAMEYQRVCLLFGPGSVEYNNLQRDHALAVLEGGKPQRNDPLRQVSLWHQGCSVANFRSALILSRPWLKRWARTFSAEHCNLQYILSQCSRYKRLGNSLPASSHPRTGNSHQTFTLERNHDMKNELISITITMRRYPSVWEFWDGL